LAYELQSAKVQQSIRNEEMEIEVVERKKLIDVQDKEILRKEKELVSSVKLPAESEAYKVEMIATGKRTQTVAAAQAQAQRIKLIGASEVNIQLEFESEKLSLLIIRLDEPKDSNENF